MQKQVWGDAKYLHEACERFRAGVEAPKQCIRPSILLLPPQCVNDHRPHCIAVLWNSNSSSFPAAVFVAPKAVFMKVSVFLMSAPFDSLSAELAGRVTVSRRNNIGGYFFLAPSALAFVIYLYAIMVNNWLHSIWVLLSWCIYLVFLCIWLLTMGGKWRCE